MTSPAISASILRAQVLSKSVSHGIVDAEKTIAVNKEVKKQEEAKEQERLINVARTRVERNAQIVKGDEDRIFGTDSAIKKAQACITSLHHARYAHHTASHVTDRRLLLRQDRDQHLRTGSSSGSSGEPGQRPPTVPRHDAAQGALERERRNLIVARGRLFELEESAKTVIQDLEAVRGYLSQDAAKRRFSMEQDRAYTISTLLAGPASGGTIAEPPEIYEEGVLTALETQNHVSSLEDRVHQICATSAREIKRFDGEFRQVHAQIEELLSQSTRSLGDLGKRLKGQAKEVDVTTRMAERSLGEIKKKNLTKGDAQGAKKVEALETLVSDLRITRDALQDDIRNKGVLLDIDERCRKVTTTLETLFAEKSERRLHKVRSAPSLRHTGQQVVC